MLNYIIRRTLILIPTLIVTTFIIYAIVVWTPGNPIAVFEDPSHPLSQLEKEKLIEKYGLDKPWYVQYSNWAVLFAQGDMGRSFQWSSAVWPLIRGRIWATVQLTGLALILAFIIAIPIGMISALKQYSLLDNVITAFAFFGISMPNFWFGLLLIYGFAVTLNLFPVSGMNTVPEPSASWGFLLDRLHHLVLPVIVLSTASIAGFTRYMRSQVLEIMRAEYIDTARAKGLSARVVNGKHILKNAMLPLVTLLGLSLPFIVSGALIIEQVFGWPGLGRFFYTAALGRDYPVIMGILTLTAIVTLLGNFLADISYAIVDPRIRYD
ncbi:ABC transporter permease [Candidatus Acetothermia bacterium]|nr:ABC transporter permease [Candidatus Acetothermia bacterium]MBI3643120.1 ABC transporter permease [Candidatus Acetothermia bacterium]